MGPEGSDHTDLINLVATGEGIMLEAQFLFEEALGRLRSPALAARVVVRCVGLPLFELVAAWSKAQPSLRAAEFLKALARWRSCRRGPPAVEAHLEVASLGQPPSAAADGRARACGPASRNLGGSSRQPTK